MKLFILRSLIGLCCLYMAVGCATIIHGSSQDIQINSSPDEAEIWIDGANYGKTPARINLERKDDYLVTIKKEGYKESTVKIEGNTSAWIIGNIIFGGIIGCGVDFLTGGAYDLSPERLDINLTKLALLDDKTINLPNYSFEKLKEIRFINDNGKPEVVINIK